MISTVLCIVLLAIIVHTLLGALIVPLQGAFVIDATGHSVVLGLVIGFLLTHSLHSPWIMICAIFSGLLMNILSFFLRKIPTISYDTSIGISFSFLFSLGILLLSLYARNIHLDLDMILLGNIEYALYDTITIPFINITLSYIIPILLIGLFFLLLFFSLFWKHLIILLFDKDYAKLKGINVISIYFTLITISSIIIVTSFNVTGALILAGIASSSWGYLQKKNKYFIIFIGESIIINSISGLIGVLVAFHFSLPIMPCVSLLITTVSLLLSIF